MNDKYLPSTLDCTNCSKPRRDGPEGGDSVGARIGLDKSTADTGNGRTPSSSTLAFSCTLPWPPSVNGYFASVKGRLILSAKGRAYREAVKWMGAEQKWPSFNESRVRVEFEAWVPDRRRRDLDNILKSLCDSLTHAGVWQDDSQIDDLRIYRAPLIGGMVKVNITSMEAA